MSIEEIILTHSAGRGIHKLRPYLAPNFCEQAADAILAHPGKTLIATGFYVAGTCETDGIIGAIALADALKEFDSEPVFVTDRFCAPILRQCSPHRVIDFPMLPHDESREYAEQLLAAEQPSLLISIERCGMAAETRNWNSVRNRPMPSAPVRFSIGMSSRRPALIITVTRTPSSVTGCTSRSLA